MPHIYHKNGTLVKMLNASSTTFPISAVLADRTLNDIFTIIMISMIIVNTVNMGGQLDLHIIKEVFKRPVGPIVGFASQFVIMPMVITNQTLKNDFIESIFLLSCLMESERLCLKTNFLDWVFLFSVI